jgi:integral membrane sensor domain MASE1
MDGHVSHFSRMAPLLVFVLFCVWFYLDCFSLPVGPDPLNGFIYLFIIYLIWFNVRVRQA